MCQQEMCQIDDVSMLTAVIFIFFVKYLNNADLTSLRFILDECSV